MNISLSSFAPENLVSRDGFASPVPRQPAHLHTQAESGAYLRDSSRVPRRRPFIYLMYDVLIANGVYLCPPANRICEYRSNRAHEEADVVAGPHGRPQVDYPRGSNQ